MKMVKEETKAIAISYNPLWCKLVINDRIIEKVM